MPLRARTARRLAAALVTALFVAAAPAANAAKRPFAPDSYLNTPLAPTAGIDAKSRVMVNQLVSEVRRKGATLSHDCWTTPVWTVKRRRRKVRVRTDRDRPALARQWKRVPLPRKATAACGNGHLTVWQPSTDTLWEFYRFRRNTKGKPVASWGGRIKGVSRNPGHFADPPGRRYGATATSIPLLAGLQRLSEIRAGVIDHAVAFGMPRPAPCYRWPAQRQDRDHRTANPLAPPEGARLRLPAGLDLTRLGLTPYGLSLARAVQRYGMVLRDRSGTPTFYTEAGHRGGRGPYTAIFGDERLSSRGVLRHFPWAKLQVVAVPAGKSNCQDVSPQPPPLLGPLGL